MKREHLPRLRTGSVIRCHISPCTGAEVVVSRGMSDDVNKEGEKCTCTDYYHTGRDCMFAYDATHCERHSDFEPKCNFEGYDDPEDVEIVSI